MKAAEIWAITIVLLLGCTLFVSGEQATMELSDHLAEQLSGHLDEQLSAGSFQFLEASGTATVEVYGSGLGAIIGTADSGETPKLIVTGNEKSQCDDSVERTPSQTVAWANVEGAVEGNSVSFHGSLKAQGGQFATAARCLFGKPVGITFHRTSAGARAHFVGNLKTLLRSDNIQRIRVSWSGIPLSGATLVVKDPRGIVREHDLFAGEGVQELVLPSPGLYIFQPELELETSSNGPAYASEVQINSRVLIELI